MNLAGVWEFCMDIERKGVKERWYQGVLSQTITLPGSVQENGYGTLTLGKHIKDLNQVYEFSGIAWYQKTVTIAENWRGKHMALLLERCCWETEVWVDDNYLGMQNSLATPHLYNLPELQPGLHRITIKVDNSNQKEDQHIQQQKELEIIALDTDARDLSIHLRTEQNYTKKLNCGGHHIWAGEWNGIIGAIELIVKNHIWLESCDVYADIANTQARIKVVIGNKTTKSCQAKLNFSCTLDSTKNQVITKTVDCHISADYINEFEFYLPMGSDMQLWDEFSPETYSLTLLLTAVEDDEILGDELKTVFGMRDLRTEGKQIIINGRTVFLRGTLECCIFPKTCYPAMDYASWARIYDILKLYGLNHLRFHSFCPPKAAFEAADHKGIML
ncbi:MAG: hypothetical protein H7X94_15125, partial [Vallitaleaceae bacterium]|nr:hypothetical protein [Vallitaleaceae bacterium]